MGMIVLRPWTYARPFVVIEVLISKVPIQPAIYLDCEARFRRLVTHRIGGDQRTRCSGRIRNPVALTVVLVDSVGGVERDTRSQLGRRFNEEEIIPGEIQAVAQRMANAVEEVINYSIAVHPVVVVACAY